MRISDWSSDVCSSDLALLAGGVRITQSGSDGEEILVRFIGPSEIFGCVPVLTDGLYPADATAIVDAIELSWDPADLLALMQRHSQIALNMIAIVGRRLGEAQERLRELARSAERRGEKECVSKWRSRGAPH